MLCWRIAITDVYGPSSPGASGGYRAPSGGQINFGVFHMFMLGLRQGPAFGGARFRVQPATQFHSYVTEHLST